MGMLKRVGGEFERFEKKTGRMRAVLWQKNSENNKVTLTFYACQMPMLHQRPERGRKNSNTTSTMRILPHLPCEQANTRDNRLARKCENHSEHLGLDKKG